MKNEIYKLSKLSKKGKSSKKSEKINKKYFKFPVLEFDLIKIPFLGNNPNQKYFYIQKNSEKI